MTKMMGLFITVLTLSCFCGVTFAKHEIIDITLPHPAWDGVKTMLCIAHPVKANHSITMFYPLHRMKTVRHITGHLCDAPYSTETYWECPHKAQFCSDGKGVRLYAVAKDGPAWYLPEGFAASTGSKDSYIIVQIHAPGGMKLQTTPDFFATGLRINITDQKPKYYSGMAAYGLMGYIPANTKDFTADAACVWNYDNNPLFGVYVHSHTMATAIAGYIYRDGKFIELLRADPVYPEPTFDFSDRKLVLKKGDIVVMRCTLTNPRDKIVIFGSKHVDEMCDMYLYYGIPTADYNSYEPVVCGRNAQSFRLNNTIFPEDSTFPDKEGFAKLIAPFHLNKTEY